MDVNVKKHRVSFTITAISLFIVLPLLYFAALMVFWESFYDIALFGWKQVSLSNAGTMYIPEEWDFTHDSNGEVDAVIYGPRTKSTDDYKQDRQALFVCYKAADYEKAVQNGTVYDDLNIILDNSVVVSHELENGVSWTKSITRGCSENQVGCISEARTAYICIDRARGLL